jgi:hypothetical protein
MHYEVIDTCMNVNSELALNPSSSILTLQMKPVSDPLKDVHVFASNGVW